MPHKLQRFLPQPASCKVVTQWLQQGLKMQFEPETARAIHTPGLNYNAVQDPETDTKE